MELLKGKKILITGISSERSLAFGIAKALYNQHAELGFVCQNNRICNKIKILAKSMNSNIVLSCNVLSDIKIKKLFLNLCKIWKKFDGLVHAIAYSPKDHLKDDFIHNTTRKGFNISHEISSYSLLGLIKECRTMFNNNSSILTLSYLGSKRVVPNYNVMGLAKASLEANVRYIAYSLGKENIRINAISSSPVKTVASYQIKDFKKIHAYYLACSFIKKFITIDNIGNVASFLLSDLSIGITGSVIYVDNGFNVSTMKNIF